MNAPRGAHGRRLRPFLLLVLLALAGWASGLRLYSIPGPAMAPTLPPGSTVLGLVGPWSLRTPQRFELAVFAVPLPSPWAGKNIPWVKRIVGLPGETVRLVGAALFINGQRIDQAYLHTASTTRPVSPFELTLGPDEYCVLGDNLDESLEDSRSFGPLTRARLQGRVASVLLRP